MRDCVCERELSVEQIIKVQQLSVGDNQGTVQQIYALLYVDEWLNLFVQSLGVATICYLEILIFINS